MSGSRRLGRGANVVIEAVGLPEVWEEALRMVRKGGDVTLFDGAPSETSISLDTLPLHYSLLSSTRFDAERVKYEIQP